jgi:hypothetical protein
MSGAFDADVAAGPPMPLPKGTPASLRWPPLQPTASLQRSLTASLPLPKGAPASLLWPPLQTTASLHSSPWQPWMAVPPPPPPLQPPPPALAASAIIIREPLAQLWPLQLQQPSLTASPQLPLKSPSGDPRPARHKGSSFSA